MYTTIQYNEKLNFSAKPNLIIDNYKWESNGFKPKVEVYLTHNDEKIRVKFITHESNPRREIEIDGGKVWTDSCVEFFLIAVKDDKRYINIEINANGVAVMAIGSNRNNRESLVEKYKKYLSVTSQIENGHWIICYDIPFDIIKKIYKVNDISNEISANFYKCGDCTEQPHFGMWNNIELDTPDFHVPQFFGKLLISKK